jgi:hypothetical protein
MFSEVANSIKDDKRTMLIAVTLEEKLTLFQRGNLVQRLTIIQVRTCT